MEKRLGKIESVRFGFGGYQDAMIGLSLEFSGNSWGCGTFVGTWSSHVKCDSHCKWTEEDRSRINDETVKFIDKTLREAKVDDVHQLKGKPVEVELEGNVLKSWRILTEVL